MRALISKLASVRIASVCACKGKAWRTCPSLFIVVITKLLVAKPHLFDNDVCLIDCLKLLLGLGVPSILIGVPVHAHTFLVVCTSQARDVQEA
jgi:hypothetical protein